MEERNLKTWDELKEELSRLGQEHQKSRGGDWPLLFRGQSNARWQLATSLDRRRERMAFREYYRLIGKIQAQIESLTNVEWEMPEYPEIERRSTEYEFYDDLWCGKCPGYAYMTYLRHNNFPSPLLDWTRSSSVATFFAFNDCREDSGRVAIFVYANKENRMHGNGIPMVLRYGPYVKTHPRHFLQQSEYTLCMVFHEEWGVEKYETVFNEGHHQQGVCWKFTLPATERSKVLLELDQQNVNAFSLFGSEDSMMETLATREFILAR